jgi:hypothetical protein
VADITGSVKEQLFIRIIYYGEMGVGMLLDEKPRWDHVTWAGQTENAGSFSKATP